MYIFISLLLFQQFNHTFDATQINNFEQKKKKHSDHLRIGKRNEKSTRS